MIIPVLLIGRSNENDSPKFISSLFYMNKFLGIPSTLNFIDMNESPSGSPSLIPYPSIENNVAGDCENGLSTVYRIKGKQLNHVPVISNNL